MRIAIDARMITYTGIGRYIQNLIENLAKIDQGNEYTAIVNDTWKGIAKRGGLKFQRPFVNIPIYSVMEQLLLPVEIRRSGPDLVHYPSFNMPLINNKPVVATIHDLVYYLDPDACPNKFAHYYARFMFNRAVRISMKIITDSEYVKNDIVKHLGVRPDKIEVIHLGVDELYKPQTDDDLLNDVKKRYNIRDEYIFYAGNHHPRKNLLRLVQAYSRIKNKDKYRLVLTGKIDPRRAELYQTVRDLGMDKRVHFIGSVPEQDLPALYSMATLFVFPSLNEGFGLPPLEAMACGTPVITSNVTSLPEVVGDAAIMADPMDVESLADNIDKVLGSLDLRSELREKGLKRASLFKWEEAARRTLKVYEEVLNR